MNIRLSSVHIETLSKLHEIAKKHNCFINLEVHNTVEDSLVDILDLLVDYKQIDVKVRDFILDNREIVKEHNCNIGKFILSLRDRRNGKEIFNSHTYMDVLGFFRFVDLYWCEYDSDEVEDFFNLDYEDYYEFSFTTNKHFGWENLDTSNDYHTYREGMHIKFFGDLVCDYLGEERIKEIY